MRKRILKRWLFHYGFRFTEDVANLLILDASRGDEGARLFIEQAEARHATTMFRDKILAPLLRLKAAN